MTPHTFAYRGISYRIEFTRGAEGWCGTLYDGVAEIGEAGCIPEKLRVPEAAIRSSITAAARFMLAERQQRQVAGVSARRVLASL